MLRRQCIAELNKTVDDVREEVLIVYNLNKNLKHGLSSLLLICISMTIFAFFLSFSVTSTSKDYFALKTLLSNEPFICSRVSKIFVHGLRMILIATMLCVSVVLNFGLFSRRTKCALSSRMKNTKFSSHQTASLSSCWSSKSDMPAAR